MVTIDISIDSDYHTQRNNAYIPHGSCNPTSAIMALRASFIDFPEPEGKQPEDVLYEILHSDEAWAKMRNDFPWAVSGGYDPVTVHGMLQWAINEKFVGRPVDRFSTRWTMQEILHNIACNGCACTMATKFTRYGHIVCVVGFETEQEDMTAVAIPEHIDLDKVKNVIVDDPYGNYHTGYMSHRGNGIRVDMNKFNSLTSSRGYFESKWAHYFSR